MQIKKKLYKRSNHELRILYENGIDCKLFLMDVVKVYQKFDCLCQGSITMNNKLVVSTLTLIITWKII